MSAPTRLAAQINQKTQVDPGARVVVVPCAHPDGLLGHYEVLIPFLLVKQMAGMIIQNEGNNELQAMRQAAREKPSGLTVVKDG